MNNPKSLYIDNKLTASELKVLCNQLEKELRQKPMMMGSVEFMKEYECEWIGGTKEYNDILNQIEYMQEVVDRCKEIITDKNEINKLNKIHMRINTVNNITYDIMSIIEDLQK